MLITIKSTRFQLDIQTWNVRPLADKIWDNFKDAFRSAYDELRDLGDLTLDQSPALMPCFNCANWVVNSSNFLSIVLSEALFACCYCCCCGGGSAETSVASASDSSIYCDANYISCMIDSIS